MPEAIRYDGGEFKLDEANGFISGLVTMAKPGVYEYVQADGKVVMEAKLPEELFSKDTLDSAKMLPSCKEHPPVTDNGGLIDGSNYSKYAKGSLGDTIEVKENFMTGREKVWDSEMGKELKNGNLQTVSMGFQCDLDFTPGEFNGQKYDAVQRNIRYNHMAHTDSPRLGEEVRIHLDSKKGDKINYAIMKHDSKEKKMPEIKLDDKTKLEVISNFFQNLFSAKKKDDDNPDPSKTPDPNGGDPSKKTPDPKSTDASDIEALKMQVQMLQQMLQEKTALLEQANSAQTQDSLVNKRIKLIEMVKAVDATKKTDGLSEKELKLFVIEKNLPFADGTKIDSLKQDQLDARFDAACEFLREKAALRGDGENLQQTKLDEAAVQKKRQDRLNVQSIK
ncbi:MAG: DUF2213 domain-containing protein [Leptospira sp.]|nr:DUF2213 domain-containing protein [Leptospira sp.]